MIKGCLNLGRNALYRQGNNVIEEFDGPALNWCNTTAIANAWAAVTPRFDDWRNPFGGSWRPQPEDLAALYLQDEENWPKLRQIRDLPLCHGQPHDGMYPPEQIPQYHQAVLRELFKLGADFSYSASFSYVSGETARGTSCILRLVKPGHFVTAVAYDDEKMLIGFRDPAPVRWLQETEDLEGLKWMGAQDFKDNVHTDVTRVWRV